MMRRSALFLDRDGTLIYDRGYLADPDGVELLPGTVEALALLRNKNLALVVITNQSGIGRGLFSLNAMLAVNKRLANLLREHTITFDALYYCPHAPAEGCECRKPSPGMLHRAAHDLGLDLQQSFMVGDKLDDVIAGKAAGCRGILLSASPQKQADFVAENLVVAANWVVDQMSNSAVRGQSNVAKYS